MNPGLPPSSESLRVIEEPVSAGSSTEVATFVVVTGLSLIFVALVALPVFLLWEWAL